ncbi:MAG: hypothetical protein COA42_05745 [Alteromonadaceae bacterium]|nr:MAG: hypothetical protein COA42_05745 [Alteromonadaceae bacterium]
MAFAIKILLVITAAHYASFFVLSRLVGYEKELKQYVINTAIIIGVSVITRQVLLSYLAAGVLCFVQNKRSDPSTKIAFFFGMAFIVGYTKGFYIRVGGNLGGLSHSRILVLVLLLPLLLSGRPDKSISKFNTIDKFALAYFAWVALLNVRQPSITSLLRTDLWLYIDHVVVYIVIRRYADNYGLLLASVTYALLAQAVLGVGEALMSWHIYPSFEKMAGYVAPSGGQYKVRYLFLRAQASLLNPLIFALFANMSFLTTMIYILKVGIVPAKTYTKLFAFGAVFMAFLGTAATGSRAGMAGNVLILLISGVLIWAMRREKDPKALLLTGVVFCLGAVVIFGQDFLTENFEYRMRLLDVGSGVIMTQPIFGDLAFRKNPMMQTLELGEGIIDVVNTYLSIALSHGLPALIFFVGALGTVFNRLYNSLRLIDGNMMAFGIFAFSSLLVLAFNLATTSAFGWTYPWMWICVAFGSNIVARTEALERAKKPKASPFGDAS